MSPATAAGRRGIGVLVFVGTRLASGKPPPLHFQAKTECPTGEQMTEATADVKEQYGGPFDPLRHRKPTLKDLFAALRKGLTLPKAAAEAGVHPATVRRWARGDESGYLADMLADFRERRRELRRARKRPRQPRPHVVTDSRCPDCGGEIVCRTTRRGARYWRCSVCDFQRWRPRAVGDCPDCGGPRFWSCSRKSVACAECGRRDRQPAPSPAPGGSG
jgi:hypothetical protein